MGLVGNLFLPTCFVHDRGGALTTSKFRAKCCALLCLGRIVIENYLVLFTLWASTDVQCHTATKVPMH